MADKLLLLLQFVVCAMVLINSNFLRSSERHEAFVGFILIVRVIGPRRVRTLRSLRIVPLVGDQALVLIILQLISFFIVIFKSDCHHHEN